MSTSTESPQTHTGSVNPFFLKKNLSIIIFSALTSNRKTFAKSDNNVTAKVFKSLKNLRKLVINDLLPWKCIKACQLLPHLEIFSLKIQETDIPHLYRIFREAPKLHTVELAIKKDGRSANFSLARSADLSWKLLKDLFSLKNLKSLQLIIEDCSFTQDSDFFYRLLGMLGERNIETFLLQLFLTGIEDKPNEAAQRALSQVKALSISSNHGRVYSSSFESMIPKQKKVALEILPQYPELQVVDISNLLSKCSGLRALNLKDKTGKFGVSPDSKFALDLRSLHLNIYHKNNQKVSDLLAYLANGPNNSGVDYFHLELYNFTDDILRQITKLNSSFSPERIQDYSIATVDEQAFLQALQQMQEMDRGDYQYGLEEDDLSRKNYFSTLPANDLFRSFAESISRLTSLQKLSLFTRIEDENYLKSIGDSFEGLSNLQECEIQFYQGSKYADDHVRFYLPLYKLSSLQELSITLPSNFIFNDFVGLLDKMSQLQDLQYFILGSNNLDLKDKELMNKISLILKKSPKCKKLYIDQEDEDSITQRFFISATDKECEA